MFLSFIKEQKFVCKPVQIDSAATLPWPFHYPDDTLPATFYDSAVSLLPQPDKSLLPHWIVRLVQAKNALPQNAVKTDSPILYNIDYLYPYYKVPYNPYNTYTPIILGPDNIRIRTIRNKGFYPTYV